MPFELLILGSGSANPLPGRNFPSILLRHHSNQYLIDCGEGTQFWLMKHKVNLNNISAIFISHLHADHYQGLFGLLSTMNLRGREFPLSLIGPRGLSEIISIQLRYSLTRFKFEIHFKETTADRQKMVYEDRLMEVLSLPLSHKIETSGFYFKEKRLSLNIDKTKLSKDFPVEYIKSFKAGENVLDEEGNLLYNFRDFTLPETRPCTFAYCSDTEPVNGLEQMMPDVGTIYHEATFLESEREKAGETRHSTAGDAARLAKAADAHTLILGHFSSRYLDLDPFLREASTIFPNTILAKDGLTLKLETIGN